MLKNYTMRSLLFICFFAFAFEAAAAERPNILFIAVDDLRPELGCYGSPVAISPNLDALAKDGLLFGRAYCQQAICRPSRASLMTGARPETTGLFHNYVSLRELQPDILTLPQHLVANGYETAYCGKIFHQGDTDEGKSWSRDRVKWVKGIKRPSGPYALPENNKMKADNMKRMRAKYGAAAQRGLAAGPAYEKADVPDTAYVDGYNTQLAIATMKEMAANTDKPFFLGMGYKLPHLNWCSPTKYWDLYDPAKIPMASETEAPQNGAAMGLHASFELRTRAGIPKNGPLGPELSRTLKHAYLASTSYVDAQIGLMVQALEDAGVRDNTIIIVWGDHGWHLGDMGVWGKATNYEIATRVPLMIWTPNMKTRGRETDALVELVDIYPTLCELTGVPIPDHVEGHSFVRLLDNPEQRWKKAAFSQYPNPALREWAANPLSPGMRETWFGPLIKEVEQRIIAQQGDKWNRELFEKHLMGYTMRTDRYRLVVWRDHRDVHAEPVYVELFDHETDPNETRNIAGEQPETVDDLRKQLDAGWQAALTTGGELDPQQREWHEHYKKQVNAPQPEAMLLNTDAEPNVSDGFTSLFNGKDLTGWTPRGGTCKFEVRDGLLVGKCVPESNSTYLSTEKVDFTDFVFSCDMKWEVDCNSGVMFRARSKPGKNDTEIVFGPQAEMEGFSKDRHWSGGVYGQSCGGFFYPLWLKEHKEARAAAKEGEWNRLTIHAKGNVVKTWINGVPAAHWVDDGTYPKGFFGLQIHKGAEGTVLWKNLRVKSLAN